MSRYGLEQRRQIYIKKIERRLNDIGSRMYSDLRPVDIYIFETKKHLLPEEAEAKQFKKIRKGYQWGTPWSSAWFRLSFTVASEFKGEPVVLLFDCGGEAVAFIDCVPVQGLDRNRDDILLFKKATGGERFEVLVEAGANSAFGKYRGRCEVTRAEIGVLNRNVRDYFYDLQACYQYIEAEHIENAPTDETRVSRLLFACNKSVDLFEYQNRSRNSIRESAIKAAKALKDELNKKANVSAQIFACIGHAHIDVAWLWPLAETVRKCARSFSTVVRYMDEYPEYRFAQSQPQLYEFTKQRYPALYERIKEKVRKKQWEPVGGMWVEADCNVPSGESLVRQILFGTRFFKKEFDYDVDSLWLPDVFGYPASLPQILVKSGLKYFTTIKISWSQFTNFPYHTFYWQGIDGTRILSHLPPSNDYNSVITATQILKAGRRYNEKDRLSCQLHQYGYGDGGGGPTKGHIERIRRYKNFEGMPRTVQMSSKDFFSKIEQEAVELPEWVGELYLELHRGTLTTQGYNKRNNRKSEFLYRDAEFLSSWNVVKGGTYRQEELNAGWKKILLNQFHDIIPGSSIDLVYKDSDRDYEWILQNGKEIRKDALDSLSRKADTGHCKKPAVIFNSLSWLRRDIVEIPGMNRDGTAVSPQGETAYVQSIGGKGCFHAEVPSMGYAVYDIKDEKVAMENRMILKEDLMENDFFRIRFDKNGEIRSLFDKVNKREVLKKNKKGNVLKLFEDKPNQWDAWDIDIFYAERLLETAQLKDVRINANGPVVGILRQERTVSHSRIVQNIKIYAETPRIDFETEVYWGGERDVMLKVSFPVEVSADRARYEIQFGNTERPTHGNRPADFAMFEVCGHKWADVSEGNYGVSLLNDCKYGYSIRGSDMNLTLLRAPKEPDPEVDVNKKHVFVYSLFPHRGDYKTGTVRMGYELNVPLMLCMPLKKAKQGSKKKDSLLCVDAENIMVDTVKKCEDSNGIVVRLYEAHRMRGKATLSCGFDVSRAFEVNLMEKEIKKIKNNGNKVTFSYEPFEIKTFKLEFKHGCAGQ